MEKSEKTVEQIRELQRDLNKRNEATKVWIQSDTQARAYATQLEAENARLREALKTCAQVVCGSPDIAPYLAGTIRNEVREALNPSASIAQTPTPEKKEEKER